ncbi:MAG: WecB/TagA/CpsF family glycosyltransferase [Candidatus Saccharimonadales bacterium]
MSKQHNFDKVDLLGVSVDVVYLSEAIKHICALAADRTEPAGYVVKPYVEFLDRAAGDPKLTGLLGGAELSIADGVAVLWAAHYLYAGPRTPIRFFRTLGQIMLAPAELAWPIPERAAGVNFTWPLLHAAAEQHLRVYLIGKETSADIEQVAAVITKEIPQIIIAGTLSGRDQFSPRGRVSEEWLAQTAGRLTAAKPDLVLVGLGFPLQENVCATLASELSHGILIGEGGTFDYDSFGGTKRKAPAAVQRVGLEWLWRLILEPKRFVRQLAIPRFILKIWKSRR